MIYGRDYRTKVVAIEPNNSTLDIFYSNGTVENIPHKYWCLSNCKLDSNYVRLEGNNHYKYIRTFSTKKEKSDHVVKYQRLKKDIYTIWNSHEESMIYHGLTLFKDLKLNELSVLSFDIEGSGLVRDKTSKVFLITNTFRKNDKIIKKHFRVDEYSSDVEMMREWATWVCSVNPDIVTGHNIFGYDLDYMNYIMEREGEQLYLGRDGSELTQSKKPGKKRISQNNEWEYKRAYIYGRHIIDTMFLAVNYDIKRNYPAWGLKPIIQYELSKANKMKKSSRTPWQTQLIKSQVGRTFYEAENIGKNWEIPEEREKIVKYGIDDSDDALALFDLMIPSFFYYNRSIPRSFQEIVCSASGGQINSFLVRSYLQENHSIPKSSNEKKFGGGISFGNPGIYKNIYKVDVASLYPSIIITEKIYDRIKDPKGNFLKMVEYFTTERLKNKQLGKTDPYYKDLEQAQKIVINSAYGALGTKGLNFNNYDWAGFVTEKGREILQTGVKWACGRELKHVQKLLKSGKPATKEDGSPKMKWVLPEGEGGKNFDLVNVDTDSFSFSTPRKLSTEEFDSLISELNKLYKKGIVWEDDGAFKSGLIVKAKNYVLEPMDKNSVRAYKGASLLAKRKEKALQQFNEDIINLLLSGKKDSIMKVYMEYCQEVLQDSIDISRWTSRFEITKTLLEGDTPDKKNKLDALKDKEIKEGDKFYSYYNIDDKLTLKENYSNNHSKSRLLKKIFASMKTFENVLDIEMIPNFDLGRNKEFLEWLKGR